MFPGDAITYYGEFTASTTSIFEDADEFTILNINSSVSNNNSPLFVRCGSEVIYSHRLAGQKDTFLNEQCNGVLVFQKTNNNIGTVNITYVPRFTELSTSSAMSTVGYNPSSDISSSSDVQIYGSISAGEFIISAFLLIFLVFKMMELIARGLSGITTNRQLMRYNGGDVPVDKE